MPDTNELRVFVSSTFQDLQEEREHLVKKIFPEIRSLCRERGITFTEVDLRWGLTHEEGTYGRIIRTCLEEIDRCRPYFIGITGNRYGYTPDFLEIQKDPDLMRQYPWIEEATMEEMSITAMEIKYAVLDDPASADRARFYFRRQRASLQRRERSDEENRLEALQANIRESGARIETFRDPASLGELVYDDLIEIIRRDFSNAQPPTPLEKERSTHQAFSASRRRAYIANPSYLKRLYDWFDSDEPPMVIYAESGSGKSSLVAYWAEQMRKKEPELFIVEHYVGIGAGDADHLGLIKHVMEEIKERFDRDEEVPEKPEEIESGLGQWLGYAVHGLQQEGSRMILILDGLNQLGEKAQHLRWIPDVMSPEIRLILTSTIEETLVKLRERGWIEMGMQPLSEREREAVIVRYLSEYHKELPAEVVKQLAADMKCAHPLFLRTLLEELRMYGHHERIGTHVERLLESTGTEDLFQHVLERMEEDYNRRTIREVMSLLWASRKGLTEGELAEITGQSRLKLATLLLGLEYHLLRTDGLLSFFHDYLRRAVEKRYVSEDRSKEEVYRRLVGYFEGSEITLRGTLELMWALEQLGDQVQLRTVLAEVARFRLLWAENEHEVLRLWSGVDTADVVASYLESRSYWKSASGGEADLELASQVAALFTKITAWEASSEVMRTILEEARRRSDTSREISVCARYHGLHV